MTNKVATPVSELVEALRECAEMVREGKCEMLSEFWHDEAAKLTAEACAEAADRLTALEAENARLREAGANLRSFVRLFAGSDKAMLLSVSEWDAALSTAAQGGDHGE